MDRIIEPIWNNVVNEERPAKPRSHVRSSELGNPFVDRWLSMMGTPVTNPVDPRVLRIFDAGRVIEFMVMRILGLSGVLEQTQLWVEQAETDKHLKIVGYVDAIIGGITSWHDVGERILKRRGEYSMEVDEEILNRKANDVLTVLSDRYPDGLPRIAVEVKSINSQAFHKSKKLRDEYGYFIGYLHNKLQLYAYLTMTKIERGILLYVSKDDFTLAEVPVMLSDTTLSDAFYDDMDRITYYYLSKTMPPKEQIIVYNPYRGKFEINWQVSRSPYLSYLYNFSNESTLESYYHQHILDVNRALKHLRESKVKPEDLEHIFKYKMEQYTEDEVEDE